MLAFQRLAFGTATIMESEGRTLFYMERYGILCMSLATEGPSSAFLLPVSIPFS